MKRSVYMDHHATTPVDPRVLQAMLPYFIENFGNAASCSHRYGWEAQQAVDKARSQVARLIRAATEDIVFTSGATESNNLAIKGAAWSHRHKGCHVITVVTEHPAVLDSCKRLESDGFEVAYLPVQHEGLLDLDCLRAAFRPDTVLVSVMAANNEIGTLQPLSEIGRMCRERGVLFHSDAVQAAGKVPLDVESLSVDLMSISAHKLYGPKGVGALYLRPGLELVPLFDGGRHEGGMRSGTPNVPGIVGLGKACELCQDEMPAESVRLRALRDRLQEGICSGLDGVVVNGSIEHRLPHNLSLSFGGVDSEVLLMSLDDLALSSGSACASGEPSHVLSALGVPEGLALSTLRFGLGRTNTEEEVEYVIGRVVETVTSLRKFEVENAP